MKFSATNLSSNIFIAPMDSSVGKKNRSKDIDQEQEEPSRTIKKMQLQKRQTNFLVILRIGL